MKLAFKIARKFLSSNKGQTIFIILGIAIGVSVQVFIGSLISGLQKSLLDTTIGSSSQVTIKPQNRDEKIGDYQLIIDKIKKNESQLTFISPVADASGFLKIGDSTYPILLRGFDFNLAEGIYKLKQALIEGDFPETEEVMLGKELVEEANLHVGESVIILTPLGNSQKLTISGIFDLKVSNLNKGWAIAEMYSVQHMFDFENQVTSIETQVNDVFKADTIGASIAAQLPNTLIVENWKDMNASLLSGLNGQSVSSLMIQIFVLISVILAIASVLAISVSQKSKQIGILKAMGIRNAVASQIFLLQGFILGIFGSLLGVSLGLGLALSFTKFAVKPDGSPVIKLFIDPQFIAVSALIAVISATLAALVPASSSSKLEPIEVIRNG